MQEQLCGMGCWGISTANVQFLLQIHNKEMFDLEIEGQSDGAQRQQYHFVLAFTIAEIFRC